MSTSGFIHLENAREAIEREERKVAGGKNEHHRPMKRFNFRKEFFENIYVCFYFWRQLNGAKEYKTRTTSGGKSTKNLGAHMYNKDTASLARSKISDKVGFKQNKISFYCIKNLVSRTLIIIFEWVHNG